MFNSKKNLKKDLKNFMQHQNIFGQFLYIFNFTKRLPCLWLMNIVKQRGGSYI